MTINSSGLWDITPEEWRPISSKRPNDYQKHEPWMFDPQESVEAIMFMLTRDPKLNVKRMDLINHLQK